jgi:hypothetical protein
VDTLVFCLLKSTSSEQIWDGRLHKHHRPPSLLYVAPIGRYTPARDAREINTEGSRTCAASSPEIAFVKQS